jgi:hypothetical protein
MATHHATHHTGTYSIFQSDRTTNKVRTAQDTSKSGQYAPVQLL